MLYANIKKRLGSFTLDIEIDINGDTLALLGASGCGKSMTLKCIAGVEKPDEGIIVLNDRVLFDSKKKINLLPQERKVGLLFQNYALFPNMTLEENISIAIPKCKSRKKEIIKDKIKAFSLEGLENNYPHQLSGGQQQRVALARMLVNEPEILMLDEPFSALDEHLRWQMEEELVSVLQEHNGSTLYVSHNKDEVYRICDKIAVFVDGKIVELNERDQLFQRPRTLHTATLTGCKNISRAEKIQDNLVHAIDWGIELVSREIVQEGLQYVGIHSHNIHLHPQTNDGNIFEFRIGGILKNLSMDTLILSKPFVDSPSPHLYMDMLKTEALEKDLVIGKSVYINLNKENILLLY